jgi:hypothetical protein
MLHQAAEERGELRSTVEVESGPILTHTVTVWNPADWLRRLQAGEPDHSAVAELAPVAPLLLPVRLQRSLPLPNPNLHPSSRSRWSGQPLRLPRRSGLQVRKPAHSSSTA